MYPCVLIETNKIWKVEWEKLQPMEKADNLRQIILEIAEHLNKMEDTPARSFATTEDLEREVSQMYHNFRADLDEKVEELVENEIGNIKQKHNEEMNECQKIIRDIEGRLEKLEK